MSTHGDSFSDRDFEADVFNHVIAEELRGLHGQGIAFEDMPGDPRLIRLARFIDPELDAASAEYDEMIAPVMERFHADEAALIAAGHSPEEAKRIMQGRILEAFTSAHTKEGE